MSSLNLGSYVSRNLSGWEYWTCTADFFRSRIVTNARRHDGLVHAHVLWGSSRWLALCASFYKPMKLVKMTRPTSKDVTCLSCIAVMP